MSWRDVPGRKTRERVGFRSGFRYPCSCVRRTGGRYAVQHQPTTKRAPASARFGNADGTGSAARFDAPAGVVVNGENLYVVEGNKVRIGRPALTDIATIDFPTGTALTTRQPSTSTQTATSWQWSFVLQPSASTATLSSTSIRNPVFTPDVAGHYIFQLTASDGVKTSITNVELTATPVKIRSQTTRGNSLNGSTTRCEIGGSTAGLPAATGPMPRST